MIKKVSLLTPNIPEAEVLTGIRINKKEDIIYAGKKLLDMGYYISFSGNLTFKNSTLPSVAKYLPLNRLLVETDSPYLSPEPFRGKSNEPGRTRYVAEKLAEIHNISFESIANQTTKNINKLFSI